MSSKRFKTIILLMLVLVNLSLLAVSLPVHWQRSRRRTELETGLAAMMSDQQITFDPAILPEEQRLYELELSFSADRELEVVNQLIAGARADLSSPYQTSWSAGDSWCIVELAGALTVQLEVPPETEPTLLLEQLGFDVAASQRGLRTLTVWQRVAGAKLLTPLRLSLEEDRVSAMEGYFLLYEGDPLRISERACCSAADALVAFLASRDSLGWVGSAVTAMEQGYVPDQSPASLRLRPVWRIATDAASYEVDGLTRTVYLVE